MARTLDEVAARLEAFDVELPDLEPYRSEDGDLDEERYLDALERLAEELEIDLG